MDGITIGFMLVYLGIILVTVSKLMRIRKGEDSSILRGAIELVQRYRKERNEKSADGFSKKK